MSSKNKSFSQFFTLLVLVAVVMTYAYVLDWEKGYPAGKNIAGAAGGGIDSDETSCVASTFCSGNEYCWADNNLYGNLFSEGADIAGEYESNCCADDTQENLDYFQTADEFTEITDPEGKLCEKTSTLDCAFHRTGDYGCCKQYNKCVFKGACYDNADILKGNNLVNLADSGNNYAWCGGAWGSHQVWFDCDSSTGTVPAFHLNSGEGLC